MKTSCLLHLQQTLILPWFKMLCCFVACCLFLVCPARGEVLKEEVSAHLFILSGQSNMARMDPGLSFVPAVEAAFGAGRVIVVHAAWGGQPIRRWYRGWKSSSGETTEPTGDLYDRMMTQVNQAVGERSIETVTFVWMQGERDALRRHGDVYEESLRGLIRQLTGDLGHDDIHLVIGRLSDSANYKDWRMVRAAQMEVAGEHPRAVWIDTDDLNSGINEKGAEIHNDLHFSVDGYKILGQRFADAAILLIKKHTSQGHKRPEF